MKCTKNPKNLSLRRGVGVFKERKAKNLKKSFPKNALTVVLIMLVVILTLLLDGTTAMKDID